MNIPEGWKLVPVVPTEEMLTEMVDGFISLNGDNRAEFNRAYPAMLAAAPTPPAPEVEPVAYMRVVTERWGIEYNKIDEWSDGKPGGIPLYTRPADDGLRKVAGEAADLLQILDSSDEFDRNDGAAILHNLRAELNKDKSC